MECVVPGSNFLPTWLIIVLSFILPWITPGLAHIIMSKILIMMPGTVLSMLKGLT